MIIWTIKLLINIFQLIEFFPWLFVPLSINTRINVSKISTPKCISTGILFAPKSIYKTPLSYNINLFSLLTASSLLIPHKIHLKSTPFTFNTAMFFLFISSHQIIMTFNTNMWFKFKSNIFKIPIITEHSIHSFDAFVLWMPVPSETPIFLYYCILITYMCIHAKKIVDNIYHLFQEQV